MQRNGYRSKASQKKKSEKERGEYKNGTKHTNATNKRQDKWASLEYQREPIRKDRSHVNGHISIFDPNKYMLKLPKTKKVTLPTGQVRFERIEADYLPVAARIAWFRREHPLWSIITEVEQLGNKAVVMKATIKDMLGTVIATARKKETESGFLDYIEKAETGTIGRALAMCGYGTLQAPEFDEQDRLADTPVEKRKTVS